MARKKLYQESNRVQYINQDGVKNSNDPSGIQDEFLNGGLGIKVKNTITNDLIFQTLNYDPLNEAQSMADEAGVVYPDVATLSALVATFKRASGGGTGAVDSVFGRTGAVVAQFGDYQANQIQYASKVIVSNLSDFPAPVGNVITLQNVVYEIDGTIDLVGNNFNIDSGATLIGTSQNASIIVNTTDNFTLFTGGGNLFLDNLKIEISGANSKVFGIVALTGFEAVEFSRIWLNNCTSLGFIDHYRQYFSSAIITLLCSDGLEFRGTWLGGAKIANYLVRASTGTAFKAGAGLVFNTRFNSEANLSVPYGNLAYDFEASNFANDGLYQLQGGNFQDGGYNHTIYDGVTSNLEIATATEFDFTADFGVDFWFRSIDLSLQGAENRRIYSGGIEIMFNPGTNGVLVYDATTMTALINSGSALNDGNEHHINVFRNSGTITLEIDGVNFGSAVNSDTFLSGSNIVIGKQAGATVGHFVGEMWNLRVKSGSFLTFTPPTLPIGSGAYVDKTDVILFLPKDTDGSRDNRTVVNNAVTLSSVQNGSASYLKGIFADSVKSNFRNNTGLENTYPSAQWTNLFETPNTFTVIGQFENALVSTSSIGLVWFDEPTAGTFRYISDSPSRFLVQVVASVFGSNNKVASLGINYFEAKTATNSIVGQTTATTNGGGSGLRAENVSVPPVILTLSKNDTINLQIANNTDLTNMTIAGFSRLIITEIG